MVPVSSVRSTCFVSRTGALRYRQWVKRIRFRPIPVRSSSDCPLESRSGRNSAGQSGVIGINRVAAPAAGEQEIRTGGETAP